MDKTTAKTSKDDGDKQPEECEEASCSKISEKEPKERKRRIGDVPSTSDVVSTSSKRKELPTDSTLIDDFSKPCILPLIEGEHEDIKTITPDTVAMVLDGKFAGKFTIIDGRYPFEYEGGHIRDARNVYSVRALGSELLYPRKPDESPKSNDILIFYCEFSSKRSPLLYRKFRAKDRQMNIECYPLLCYPEMYVMGGGYKSFFNKFKDYCEPQGYTAMLDKTYRTDLLAFRDRNRRIRRRKRTTSMPRS